MKKKTIFKIGNIPTKALQSINKINTLFINYSGHEHIAEQKDYHIIQDGFAINAEKNLIERYGHFIVLNVIMIFSLTTLKMKT